MISRRNSMGRELGTAFAVLAIYVLTLLLPLHQAAGLQRDLDALGFETLTSWSVCQALAEEDGQPSDTAIIKCPATGQFKDGFAPMEAIATEAMPTLVTGPVGHARVEAPPGRSRAVHVGDPRAPPLA